MLIITWEDRSGSKESRVWHVNERVPAVHGRVVTFQADGHELDHILTQLGKDYTYGKPAVDDSIEGGPIHG